MHHSTYLRRHLFSFAACFGIAVAAHCDELPSSPAMDDPSPATEILVVQLGNDSYQQRERASNELLQIGLQSKTALMLGMRDTNPEIASRCRLLWDEVRINVGWQQVSEIIGNSPAARTVYDKMFLSEPELWFELAENPTRLDQRLPQRRAQLQQTVERQSAARALLEGALANTFYFGLLAQKSDLQKESNRIDDLLRVGRCQQAIQDDAVLRDLRNRWTSVTSADSATLDRLFIALKNSRSQARQIARKMLTDEDCPPDQRQYALLTLAKINHPDDAGLVQRELHDPSPLDTLFTAGVLVKSQIADIALAATIHRAGQDPKRFGFVFAKTDPEILYTPATLGFIDDNEREVAFRNWFAFASVETNESE